MGRTKNPPKPTWTGLTYQALLTADDFMSLQQLLEVTKASVNQLTAALHSLKTYQAVDSVESGGRLYWFATPLTDKRSRQLEERRPEDPGTRRRMSKYIIPPAGK